MPRILLHRFKCVLVRLLFSIEMKILLSHHILSTMLLYNDKNVWIKKSALTFLKFFHQSFDTASHHHDECLRNIVLRDRQAGGYDFCKPAGVISSQGAKPRGMKLLPRVSKNHMPPSLAITQQYCYVRLLNKKPHGFT